MVRCAGAGHTLEARRGVCRRVRRTPSPSHARVPREQCITQAPACVCLFGSSPIPSLPAFSLPGRRRAEGFSTAEARARWPEAAAAPRDLDRPPRGRRRPAARCHRQPHKRCRCHARTNGGGSQVTFREFKASRRPALAAGTSSGWQTRRATCYGGGGRRRATAIIHLPPSGRVQSHTVGACRCMRAIHRDGARVVAAGSASEGPTGTWGAARTSLSRPPAGASYGREPSFSSACGVPGGGYCATQAEGRRSSVRALGGR